MKKSYLKYFFALILFGLNGIIASHISLSSYEIVFLRTMIGSLSVLLIFLFKRTSFSFFRNWSDTLFLLLSGMAMGASWLFLYEAFQLVGVSISTLLYYCGPIIVILLSPLIFQEKITMRTILGFLIVLLGVLFIQGAKLSNKHANPGLLYGAMSALMYALMVIANKKVRHIAGMENALLQLLFSFFTVAVYLGFKQGFRLTILPGDWRAILTLGILNTGVGCYLYFSSIGKLSSQTVAICGYIEPLSAVLFSVLLLHETLTPLEILGAVLILGGAIGSAIRKTRYTSADAVHGSVKQLQYSETLSK